MKKLVLSLAIFTSVLAFSQKEDVNAQIQTTHTAAMEAYNSKNYDVAAPKFIEVYNLLKSTGQDNKIYMYYAGLSYAVANKNIDAIRIYSDLVNSGFTGIENKYTAKEKKTGVVSEFNKKAWEIMKKSGSDYTDFKTEQTPSVEVDLYETLATLLLTENKNEEALAIIKKGLQKFPNSAKLNQNQGTAFYRTGKTNEFVTSLKEQVAKNPNDAESWYNLGVMQSQDPSTNKDAITSFEKAIQIKPDFANAYKNLILTAVGDDEKMVKEINTLRKSDPDKATTLIDQRRERFNKAIPYAEKWYQIMPNNIDAVSTLRDVYVVTKNNEKVLELKKKLELLEKNTK